MRPDAKRKKKKQIQNGKSDQLTTSFLAILTTISCAVEGKKRVSFQVAEKQQLQKYIFGQLFQFHFFSSRDFQFEMMMI